MEATRIEAVAAHAASCRRTVVGLVVSVVALLAALAVPVAVVAALLGLSRRRLAGRRGRLDGLFGGIARGEVMSSHLQAGTPHPDDIAVPAPRRKGR
jgi:hypothetical protein